MVVDGLKKCVGFLQRERRAHEGGGQCPSKRAHSLEEHNTQAQKAPPEENQTHSSLGWMIWDRCGNDPSAGSPTETLLRLHLPLNGKV